MVKNAILVLLAIFLSGCATYKFERHKAPGEKGYVVSRDDYVILEYTVGKDNSVPDLKLAQERFNRRRRIVEHCYKKTGYIDNHFKMVIWNPFIYTFKTMKGVFRLPFIAISDYRYEHNPRYREKMDKRQLQQDAQEEAYIKKLKDELNVYIQRDIASEQANKGLKKTKEEKSAQEIMNETLARMEQGPAQ